MTSRGRALAGGGWRRSSTVVHTVKAVCSGAPTWKGGRRSEGADARAAWHGTVRACMHACTGARDARRRAELNAAQGRGSGLDYAAGACQVHMAEKRKGCRPRRCARKGSVRDVPLRAPAHVQRVDAAQVYTAGITRPAHSFACSSPGGLLMVQQYRELPLSVLGAYMAECGSRTR